MYKFSFLLPTRDRPELVNRFFQSILDTAYCIEEIEVILCLDDDDLESQNISNERLFIKKVVLPRGSNMGALNRACFEASSGRYVMLINDDVIIRTKGWDKMISVVYSAFPDDIALIHVNDLLFRDSLCTFPTLSRKACLEIGICPEEYRKYRIDDHIYDTYQMLAYLGHKRIVYLDKVVFEHDNKIRNQQTPASQSFKSGEREGEISLSNKEIIESDGRIFNEKIEERKQNALTLARLIDQDFFERKPSIYRAFLNAIKDPYSYRKKEFVKRIELAQIGTTVESPALNVTVIIPNIQEEGLKKCVSMLKRYTPNSEPVILNESDGSLIGLDRDEGLLGNKKSFGEVVFMRPVLWIISNQYTRKIIGILGKIVNKYYNLPYPVRRVTDGLMVWLIKKIRTIQYRKLNTR
ncbi:MAG: glycosyltransferase family A protein [Thermodesulfobacteriota bacterium]